MSWPAGLYSTVVGLYDQNRFVDAHEAIRGALAPADWTRRAGPEELILAARLANQLGGVVRYGWWSRAAVLRFPDAPVVRAHVRWCRGGRSSVIQSLEDYQRCPQLNSGSSRLDAEWLIDSAYMWGVVRDFARAHELLAQAREQGGPIAWGDCVEARVFLMEERWAEAAEAGARAWRTSPGKPAAADVMARALVRLGRLEEALAALAGAAEGQSFTALSTLLWVMGIQADRLPAPARAAVGRRAAGLCDRLEQLALMGDRLSRSHVAFCRFDAAMLAGDVEAMKTQAAQLASPAFRNIAERLRDRPAGDTVLVPHETVYQKFDRCLPTSVACVAGAMGAPLQADELAAQVTYDGTATWRIMAWLKEHGYAVQPFLLEGDLAVSLLRAGLPFVYLIESMDSSHATAAVGYDETIGVMAYHDPAGLRLGRVLLDKLSRSEAPAGPWALALAPAQRAGELARIPPAAARAGELWFRFKQETCTRGALAAAEVAAQARDLLGPAPLAKILTATVQLRTGETLAATETLEELAREFPDCIAIRRCLLEALGQTGNTATTLQVMEQIVRRGRTPGIRTDLTWEYPPPSCLTRYADLLGLTREGAPEAQRQLRRLLARDPTHAMGYHVLGDILFRLGRKEQAALPYRLASLLSETDEHFAWTAYDSLRLAGRVEEALAYLHTRVERLGALVEGQGPWMTLIEALEDVGRPAEAMTQADRARRRWPAQAAMNAFLARFWVRQGRWEQAEESLEVARGSGNPVGYLRAAVECRRTAGRWKEALLLARQWVAQAPNAIDAYRVLAELEVLETSAAQVLERTRQWADARAGDEDFELLHYEQLRDFPLRRRAGDYLRRRLERNPRDTWAWVELGHWLIDQADCLLPRARQDVLAELQEVCSQVRRLAPGDHSSLILQARLAGLEGRWPEAEEALLEALRQNPANAYIYERAFEFAAHGSLESQRRLLERLEERMMQIRGPLHVARELALRVGQRFGHEFAEQRVREWMAARPGDPELAEALADLLLGHGRGRTDAARAVQDLTEAVALYPHHFELRLSLAAAYAQMLMPEKQQAVLEELLRRAPMRSYARYELAVMLAGKDRLEDALALLRTGLEGYPRDVRLWACIARLQWDADRRPDAVDTLRQALAVMPENIYLRQQLAMRLNELGRTEQALAAAREGLEIFPDGAVFWQLTAEVMLDGDQPFDNQEVEKALRKALEINCNYYDAVDLLARLLGQTRRFEEARSLLREVRERLPNPAAPMGRLAWVTWMAGQREQAVEEMAAVLEAHPDYGWGWRLVMAWLRELDKPDLTRRVLEADSQFVRTDPDLAARRLDLLGRGALPREKTEELWRQILHDFPRDVDLHARRFDLLTSDARWDQAAEAIDLALDLCGRPWSLLARQVERLAHEGRNAEAIDLVIRIMRECPESWPPAGALDGLGDRGLQHLAVGRVVELVLQGQRVSTSGLHRALAFVDAATAAVRFQVGRKRWGKVKLLRVLMDALARCDWDAESACLAAALEHLAGCNRPAAIRFFFAHRKLCRARTPLWRSVGYLMAGGPKPHLALDWVGGWRDRRGATMTVASYYALGCGRHPKRSRCQRLYENCRDALTRLPHDRTLVFLVTRMGEALLRLGRLEEFLQAIAPYRELLLAPDKDAWLPDYYRTEDTPRRLVVFADLLDSRDAAQAVQRFRQLRRPPRPEFLYRLARRQLPRWLGFWRRLNLLLGG